MSNPLASIPLHDSTCKHCRQALRVIRAAHKARKPITVTLRPDFNAFDRFMGYAVQAERLP